MEYEISGSTDGMVAERPLRAVKRSIQQNARFSASEKGRICKKTLYTRIAAWYSSYDPLKSSIL